MTRKRDTDGVGLIGHNGGLDNDSITKLRSYVHRIETLDAQRQDLGDDIKEIKTEAKANGFDIKTVNAVLRRRKKDKAKLAEEDALLETYEGVFA